VRRDLDPNVFPAERWPDISDVYWYLQSGDHDYDTVAVDGVTAMQTLCMKFVLGDEAARDASRDPDMPGRPTWFKVTELMKTQITNFRNLPMNVIFTATQRTKSIGDDSDDGIAETFIGPNCSPAVADHLEQAVSLIGYISTREVRVRVKTKKGGTPKIKRTQRTRLLVGPSERYQTKDRYGVFGPYIDQPNLTEMIKRAYEEA
jgi:hypothetical protein